MCEQATHTRAHTDRTVRRAGVRKRNMNLDEATAGCGYIVEYVCGCWEAWKDGRMLVDKWHDRCDFGKQTPDENDTNS